MHCTGKHWDPSSGVSLKQCILTCVRWREAPAVVEQGGLRVFITVPVQRRQLWWDAELGWTAKGAAPPGWSKGFTHVLHRSSGSRSCFLLLWQTCHKASRSSSNPMAPSVVGKKSDLVCPLRS